MQAAITIGKRAFFVSFFALLTIIVFAGILSYTVPPGSYESTMVDGVEVIDPDSYQRLDSVDFPVWKILAAPVLVLFSPDSLIIIVITLFIIFVSGSITVLQNSGVIPELIRATAERFAEHKRILIALLVLIFMAFGAVMGIFEEVVLLVPIAISISLSLGWDRLTGLGLSILAAGFGFSAAISNPFSIGVAQQIAGLPLFSGAGFRVIIFAVTYVILLVFMFAYTARIEARRPALETGESGPGGSDDPDGSAKGAGDAPAFAPQGSAGQIRSAFRIFLGSLIFIVMYLGIASGIPAISGYSMPIIALLFVISALITGLAAGTDLRRIGKYFLSGSLAVLPGVLLILMAASVKNIVVESRILYTILNEAAGIIRGQQNFFGVAAVYLLVFVLNLFVGSASAKALLVMPIITPLSDILGFTRQTAVLAFSFGDGFSNLLFPTNAVLLIALGISSVSYGKWFKFVIPIQALMFFLSLGWLYLATLIGYGPY
jgi:uncharacterized ion transporter superfamily protein YfcC